MKKRLGLFLFAAVCACGQTAASPDTGAGLTILNSWRTHAGDNPAWANPDFDDSSWPLSGYPREEQDFEPGWHWYRTAALLPAEDRDGRELALGIDNLNEVYEVFIEGRPVGSFGRLSTRPAGPPPRSRVFPFPAGLVRSRLHIAIRRWYPATYSDYTEFSASFPTALASQNHPPALGFRQAVEMREGFYSLRAAVRSLPWNLAGLLMLLVAAMSFALYSGQRRRREYLYLGLYCACTEGMGGYLGMPMGLGENVLNRSIYADAVLSVSMAGWVFALLLAAELCPRYRRAIHVCAVIQGLAGASGVLNYAFQIRALSFTLYFLSLAAAFGSLIAAWGLARDRNGGSVWLAGTLAAQYLCDLYTDTGLNNTWGIPSRLHAGIFVIDIRSLATLVFVFTTLIVFYLRLRGEQVRQIAVDREFEAAREMQESLVQRLPATPGFTVETAYRPASQVGGDFYRVFPSGGGAILVVIGDVSGKGLKAAMTVSGLVCAMEAIRTRMPGPFLAELNNVAKAHLKSGFVTCCAALMEPNGEVRIANAGHLAPYADGCELEVEAGLPLGIVTGVEYPETAATGDRFTFLSDGVLEAANPTHELFGFDRSREISIQPAAAIAQAAQTWGQNDDITVVTIRRTA
jgi:hypothetical protein